MKKGVGVGERDREKSDRDKDRRKKEKKSRKDVKQHISAGSMSSEELLRLDEVNIGDCEWNINEMPRNVVDLANVDDFSRVLFSLISFCQLR